MWMFGLVALGLFILPFLCALTDPKQYYALYSFYNQTDGENWHFRIDPWDFSTDSDPCTDTWEGIACNGTITFCMNSTCGITRIFLPGLGLKNHIPDCVSNFSNLETFAVQNNLLSGPIPGFIGELSSLTALSLSNNSLTSSLPASLADLSGLVALDLNTNLLTGTIPVEFNNAAFEDSLLIFYLGENYLHGPLPPNITKMSMLRQLYVTENMLDGPLPQLCNLLHLSYLGLASNAMTGTIPSCIGTNQALKNFYMNYNSFEGTLPSSLGLISTLNYIEVGGNSLEGRIPSELGVLSSLLVLELYDNCLTGTIPAVLGNLVDMHTLQLQENYLEGSIPSQIGDVTALKLLLLFDNSLTGSIPSTIGNNSLLEELTIYHNSITGYIPASILNLKELRNILVQDNNIRGFERSGTTDGGSLEWTLPRLEHLDISENKFTGQMPTDIFTKLPSIQSLAAIKNCFSGKLPEEICEARSLQVLALDGLAAGTKCKEKFADPLGFVDSYFIRSLDGSIPKCIWGMTNLTVIHLSGNGLTGTIPSLPADSRLINISVSHNRIAGTVPHCMRSSAFVELDLSYNKIGGVFKDEVTKDEADSTDRAIFRLETNRFSGFVPERLQDVDDVNVVSGNLFDCDGNHPVPNNDPNRREYICGSKQLDQMLILWAGIFLVTIVAIIVIRIILASGPDGAESTGNYAQMPLLLDDNKEYVEIYRGSASPRGQSCHERSRLFWRRVVQWYNMEDLCRWGITEDTSPSLFTFMSLIRMLRHTSIVVSAVIAIFGIPLYIFLKTAFPNQYSTHKHQYGWLYSAAFMTGVVPAVILLILFAAVCCITSYSVVMLFPQDSSSSSSKKLSMFFRSTFLSSGRNSTGSNLMIGRGSSMVPSSRATEGGADSDDDYPTSRMCYRTGLHVSVVLCNMILCLCANALYVYTLLSKSSNYEVKMTAKLVMAVFQLCWNMFVVPKAVEFAGSLLADLESQMKWMAASMLLFNNIIAPALATAVTDDNCYNSLFTSRDEIEAYYSYPYCSIYAVDVVTEERVCFATSINGLETSFMPPFIYNYQCASAMLVNFTPVFLVAYGILAVVPMLMLLVMSFPAVSRCWPRWIVRSTPAIFWPPDSTPHKLLSSVLIKPDRIITNLMSHMSVHLTYGVASPLLAFTMSAAVTSITSLHLTSLGRYIYHHHAVKSPEAIGRLEVACAGVLSGLPACLWTIFIGTSFVFSSILLDFAGDQIGWERALFVAIPAWTVPLVAFLALRVAIKNSESKKRDSLSVRRSDLSIGSDLHDDLPRNSGM